MCRNFRGDGEGHLEGLRDHLDGRDLPDRRFN
jgi:hypothetical protein